MQWTQPLRNVERQTQDIYTLAHSTQDHQIKDKKQLINLTESINFLLDNFKEYEEDRAKKDNIIQDLKSELNSLSISLSEKHEKLQDQQEQYSTLNCLLVHRIAEEKEEITDEVIINILNQKKLDLQITLRDVERMHQIRETKKTRGKTSPITVKLHLIQQPKSSIQK